MSALIHLASAADAAHSLALEIYRFTSRWPQVEREGLTLGVRRAGWELSSCLGGARGRTGRALRRAIRNARGKHARLSYLIRLATDLGYRKLSPSGRIDEMLANLDIDLDVLMFEARDDAGSMVMGGISEECDAGRRDRMSASAIAGSSGKARRRRRYH